MKDQFGRKLPYFPWYYDVWLTDEHVQAMDWEARGMHHHLIMIAWKNRRYPCTIPKEEEAIRSILYNASDESWARAWPKIRPAWKTKGERLVNSGLLEVYGEQQEYSNSRSRNAGPTRPRRRSLPRLPSIRFDGPPPAEPPARPDETPADQIVGALDEALENSGSSETLPQPKERPPRPQPVPARFSEDSIQHTIAKQLLGNIKKNFPKVREPDLQKWADQVDKMLRLDGRAPDEILELMEFMNTSESFWRSTVLSTASLREYYDRIYAKMKEHERKKEKADARTESQFESRAEKAARITRASEPEYLKRHSDADERVGNSASTGSDAGDEGGVRKDTATDPKKPD